MSVGGVHPECNSAMLCQNVWITPFSSQYMVTLATAELFQFGPQVAQLTFDHFLTGEGGRGAAFHFR